MNSRQLHRKPSWLSLLFPCAIVLVVALSLLSLSTRSAEAASSHVDVMILNSDISPASLRFLTRAIDTAEHDGAQALVIEIDTPGGDIDSMKAMTQAELASSVPIIAYVSPTGGRAASAGAFVTLAAHIAAMAPTTRIGASSPVTSTGGDIESTLKSKIENDLIASITGVQQRYRRDVASAVAMVTHAISYDDRTAIQKHLVDLGATNLNDLLSKVQDRTVALNSGRSVMLQTATASVQMINASTVDTLYAFLLDPNVVFLLFIVAMIGIYLEISHPGVILPGVAGAIALVLFLFAAGSLSPNWAGLGLMVLAFVFLILDVQLPTHGVLTIGAVISLTVGALLFFNSGGPYGGPQVNPLVVYTMSGVIGLIGLTLVTFIVRAKRKAAPSGVASMIGAKAIALTALLPEGRVDYAGENWAAILVPPTPSLDAGSEVQIVAIEGLRLFVQPIRPLMHSDIYSVSPSA